MLEPVRSKTRFCRPGGGFLADADRLLDVRLREVHVGPERLPSVETSTDGILGGRILLEQPVNGYRTAIDPVLLAASVRAGRGERFSTRALASGRRRCVWRRARWDRRRWRGDSVESRRPGAQERRVNGLGHRVQAIAGAIEDPALVRLIGPVDQVITNPPYQKASRGRVSPDP